VAVTESNPAADNSGRPAAAGASAPAAKTASASGAAGATGTAPAKPERPGASASPSGAAAPPSGEPRKAAAAQPTNANARVASTAAPSTTSGSSAQSVSKAPAGTTLAPTASTTPSASSAPPVSRLPAGATVTPVTSLTQAASSAPPASKPAAGVAAPAKGGTARPLTPRSPRTALEPEKVELPTRRSKSARHPLVVIGNAIISACVLLAVIVGGVLYFGKERFEAPGPLAEDRIVNLPRGSGIRDIADVLTREGVIDQTWVFIGGVLVLKAREDLKAGEYQFKAHASLRDVVETIIEGKVVTHQIGVPEGLTSEQIVARLLDDDVLTGNIKEIPREGSLLPDTYNFTRGVTREQMIQRMQQAQQHLVKEIWDHRSADLPIKTPDQLVVLASLVEKETGKPDERTRVAAVFVNRLKQKMRLQSDPTIIYGLVGGKGTLGRPIMKSEIDQPTPYNTYQIDGLPPGPIANPGRASLEAAANPARTRELYFVADGTGGHVFSETYEQHQKNVARLRSVEDQKDPSQPDAQASPPAAASQAPPATTATPAPSRRTSNSRSQSAH
jgi:UPF0755 protein